MRAGIGIQVVFLCLGLHWTLQAQPSESIGIPMRDGKALAADIYRPNNQDVFPTILIMTPYGKFFYALNGLPLGIGKEIDKSAYAVVTVDWRCRFASLSACSVGSDNGEDGFDVVEWIAAQPWSDGKIGMWGPSALGNVQFETAAERPPHLVCCAPEVAAPHFSYDKYYPGGCLKIETMQTLDLLFGFADPIVGNPHYNLIWQIVEDGSMYPEQIDVPFLMIGGWYDQNTDQVLRMFDTLVTTSAKGVRGHHKLLMGPWVHGGTGQAFVGSEIQGQLRYPDAAGENVKEVLRFFDHHLRAKDNGWLDRPSVKYFQMGANDWRFSKTWPLEQISKVTYYLTESGRIDLNPALDETTLTFRYDPHDPSPSVGGKSLNLELDQGPYDQAPLVESRDDILIFTTDPFEEDLAIDGSIRVNLYVQSDQIDTDFAVRVSEVYPDGRSMLLIDGIQRMRFRDGNRVADTSFLDPNQVYFINIDLDDLAVTFVRGQSLRVAVSSSNYPRYNRNMNTGAEMHPNNNYDTLVNALVASNTLHMSATHPSHIELPISPMSTSNEMPTSEMLPWSIYPNPSHGNVQIKMEYIHAQIEIIDFQGKVQLVKQLHSKQNDLSLAGLIPGTYFMRMTAKEGNSIRKLILQ